MKLAGNTWLPDADTYFTQVFEKQDVFDLSHLLAGLRQVKSPETGIFLDLGAHVGSWSRYCAPYFKAVYAFEAAPDVFECCARNTGAFDNVFVYNKAVGNMSGRVSIVDDISRPGNTGSRFIQPGNDITMVSVDSFNFDHVAFMKLDVEGFELEVLEGSLDTILRSKPVIIMEVKKNLKLLEGKDTLAASKFLESLGYTEVDRVRNDRVYTFKERS